MKKDNKIVNLLKQIEAKKEISEIIINSPESVFIERKGNLSQLNINISLEDINDFIDYVAKFNNKIYNAKNPILNGSLEDGSRINIIGGEFSANSPSITIRKYLKSIESFDQDTSIFSLGDKWVNLLKAIVKSKMNVIVSGPTGAGKTTFINLLLNQVDFKDRIIIIEDTIEISVNNPNVVRLKSGDFSDSTKLSMRDLVKNSLRMRPDRIVLGEMRGAEVFDLLQVMNTGHKGTFSTIHASSVVETLSRIENLFLLSEIQVPLRVIRSQIATAIDYIIHIGTDSNKKKVVKQISEITGIDKDIILVNDLAVYKDGVLKGTEMVSQKMEELSLNGGIPVNFFTE